MENERGSGDHDARVLVGVDGSSHSERAFEIALSIAQRRGWPLRLIQPFTVPYAPDELSMRFGAQLHEDFVRATREVLDASVVRAREAGVEVTSRVEEGDAGRVLAEESGDARLAVVGKRGRNR
ncbi:universal stress protein, partial [Staphylococcus pseudintermedius]|uniref:universal stress protein n=1 Tax=Staphylococcus pseudintermedius TaxID=283734 RepID=UPI00101EFB20